MTRFEECLPHILRHEGGYVDHPNDPGGATNMGITHKTLARWRGISPWRELPKSAVRELEATEVARIYKSLYWDRIAANRLGIGLDLAVFDYAVNSGPLRAVKALQELVGAKKDGAIGPVTLAALATARRQKGAGWLIREYNGGRVAFLNRLRTFSIFGRGWTTRVQTILKASLAQIGAQSLSSPQQRNNPMQILSGYKTYIVAAAMLVAGIAQLLGVDISGFENQSAMQLVMEALAVLFLRRGLASGLSNT